MQESCRIALLHSIKCLGAINPVHEVLLGLFLWLFPKTFFDPTPPAPAPSSHVNAPPTGLTLYMVIFTMPKIIMECIAKIDGNYVKGFDTSASFTNILGLDN